MISADTSSLVAYFAGDRAQDTALVDQALDSSTLCISPIVLAELLSDPKSRDRLEPILSNWPLLELTEGFWLRASRSRANLLARGLTAKLPDTLIAQCSIDHDVTLIARDTDFHHFAKHCGLKLA